MKLTLTGNSEINIYYIQMLCMIFFPGAKFSKDEEASPHIPQLTINVAVDEHSVVVNALAEFENKTASDIKTFEFSETYSRERTEKIAIGAAVLSTLSMLIGYRPPWGMLTGVRPAALVTDMLSCGISKTRIKKLLTTDFSVIPKKASLAIDVALNEARIVGEPGKKDCSIYISIPFCPTRCTYCSFVSYSSKKLLSLIPDYLNRLIVDIKNTFEVINRLNLSVKTVYIGGGTPTILTAEQLRLLLSTINECMDTASIQEFTLESGRPDTIDAEKMSVARENGITRVCVNPQSLCNEVLNKIGRGHNDTDFYRAFEIVRESGIPVINTDLIVGLPGDKFSTFASTYDAILGLHPENITVHTFSVKKAADVLRTNKNIYSARGGDVSKCVDYSQIKSSQAGYKPYYMYRQKNTVGNCENVGFSVEGCEGLYNIYMMEEIHSIFAVGAGAVSKTVKPKLNDDDKRIIKRFFNLKYPYEYLRQENNIDILNDIENFYSQNME